MSAARYSLWRFGCGPRENLYGDSVRFGCGPRGVGRVGFVGKSAEDAKSPGGKAPMMKSIEDQKRGSRMRGITARDSLTAEVREELSERISRAIMASEEYKRAKVIMLYKAVKGEVKLDVLEERAAADGKKLAYPLCVGRGKMIALSPASDESWISGTYGITEPAAEKSESVRPEDIDMIICPCTAFDEQGRRAGMGGGYYDRFLTSCSGACIAAAAFEVQKADEVPAAELDVVMDKIFTEKKIYSGAFSGWSSEKFNV